MSWSAFSGGSGNVGFGNLPFTIESSIGTGSAGAYQPDVLLLVFMHLKIQHIVHRPVLVAA